MTRTEITTSLQAVFDEVFDENVKVTDDLTASEVEEWDSINHVALMIAVEKSFSFQFSLGELDGLRKVGELIDLIEQKQQVLA